MEVPINRTAWVSRKYLGYNTTSAVLKISGLPCEIYPISHAILANSLLPMLLLCKQI